MVAQYFCRNRRRLDALRAHDGASPAVPLNGIEYLEVEPGQTRLSVHFVRDLDDVPQPPLTARNVEIRGGVRVRNPRVTAIAWSGPVMTVDVETPGDFSPYTLRLVRRTTEDVPPAQIDPALAEVEFRFKVDCPSDFDCRTGHVCLPPEASEPSLDYLARDYTSFRRLMLDRLSALLPDWRERSPADLLVALVELIAFRADELTYFQDAIGTEAYLGTSRTRVSVRRHARLLDYAFHDGANARTWVAFTVGPAGDGLTIPGCDPRTGMSGTAVLTAPGRRGDSTDGAIVFETLHDVTCRIAHNTMRFYTWSDEACCLPKGATMAYLRDPAEAPLQIGKGDVLIFEEQRSPATGLEQDADRTHRHAVRLTRVDPRVDPLTGDDLVEIEWAAADALPFALCLSTADYGEVAVALGNVAAADHGATLPLEETLVERFTGPQSGINRPLLAETLRAPLTEQRRVRDAAGDLVLVDRAAPAAAFVEADLSDVHPAVALREANRRWHPVRDLLASDRFASEFVVEVEDDGRAYLRFGDNVAGRRPRAGTPLRARYRLGTGTHGNVGADAIVRLARPLPDVDVRNPLPARGGVAPHPIAQAKLYAPQAFRRQERAVTPDDYEDVTERQDGVQRAAATRRWTGSWYTTFITVDRSGGRDVDAAFEADLTRAL